MAEGIVVIGLIIIIPLFLWNENKKKKTSLQVERLEKMQ